MGVEERGIRTREVATKGKDECALGGERGSAWELAASRVCGV